MGINLCMVKKFSKLDHHFLLTHQRLKVENGAGVDKWEGFHYGDEVVGKFIANLFGYP